MRTNSRNRETTNFLFKVVSALIWAFRMKPAATQNVCSKPSFADAASKTISCPCRLWCANRLIGERKTGRKIQLCCRRLQKACTNRKNPIISPARYLERVQQPIIDPKTFSSLLSAKWTFACSALSTFPFKLSQARCIRSRSMSNR